MEPLNLLIVAIKKDWQFLITNSLNNAGYIFKEKHVSSKQEALEVCNQSRFDLMISSCTLPDGDVADLVSVLGKMLPCLVMAEGRCPVSSEHALSLLATDFYITNSEQSSWLSAVESTLSKWKANALQNLTNQRLNNSSLHKKVLARVKEELNHSDIASVLTLLLEVMDVSRIYLCVKHSSDGISELVEKSEAMAPGVRSMTSKKESGFPFFKRWSALFNEKKPVQGTSYTLPPKEQQWLSQRDAQSLLAIPIISNNTWNGFIGLEDAFLPREWSSDEINLLESVAQIIEDKHLRLNRSPYLMEGSLLSAQL